MPYFECKLWQLQDYHNIKQIMVVYENRYIKTTTLNKIFCSRCCKISFKI